MPVLKGRIPVLYLPLRTKFIILFCLLITIPFLVIGTITYQKYSSDVERNTTALTYQIVDQISINLDRYVKEMERLTLMPLYDDNVMQILNNHSGPHQNQLYLTTDETSKMNLFISSLSFDRSEVEGILIFTNDGSIFSNLDQSVSKHWEGSPEWMERVKEQDGALTLIPPHEADYYTVPKQQIVSLSRVIREPYTNKMLGIVKVDLAPRGIESLLSSVSLSSKSVLYVTNASGEVIYGSSDTGLVNLSSYINATAESDYTDLKVTGLIPLDDMRKDARDLSRFTLIVSLIALLFAYAAALISSNRLVKPIAHLQSKMRQVQRGSFKERANISSHDEIGQLAAGFNTMIGEIDRLVKEVYETRLREREAELSALQSQIHPHFLYNTLEMMNMLALQGNGRQLSSIVTSLGKLLRYTVDNKQKQVRLQDELRFVEAYLNIQAMRLGEQLQTTIHIDSSYDYCLVPKLILQPLIENVIEHAMGAGTVRLHVSARVDSDDLIITVEDDGVGIPQERLAELKEQFLNDSVRAIDNGAERFDNVKKGFALKNIHQRIRLLYGEPYGLDVDSTLGQGSVFAIRLPINWGRSDV